MTNSTNITRSFIEYWNTNNTEHMSTQVPEQVKANDYYITASTIIGDDTANMMKEAALEFYIYAPTDFSASQLSNRLEEAAKAFVLHNYDPDVCRAITIACGELQDDQTFAKLSRTIQFTYVA
jgi:hypothetical protein